MNKKEEINILMNEILGNEKLKEVMIGIANDQCLQENTEDIKERNNLFMFLGLSLALLSYSDIITMNDEYNNPREDSSEIKALTKEISKNKNLNMLITNIINHEADENESKVRLHLFLTISLAMLNNRKIININDNWNNRSPY